MTSRLTTPEGLRRQLARDPILALFDLNEKSEIPALATVITQSSIDNPHPQKEEAQIQWRGGRQATVDCSELIGLVQALTTTFPSIRRVQLTIPFQPGDALPMFKNILKNTWPASCCRFNKSVHWKSPPNHDLEAKEVLDILWEYVHRKGRLEGLTFAMNLYPDPGFLEKAARCLPYMAVKQLRFSFRSESPPASSEDFTNKLKAAFSKLRDGLERNVILERFQITTSDTSLQPTMEELVTSNFSTLLSLNASGRRRVFNLPQHRDSWLEVVSQYKLDGVYYYLRRNPWMFGPQKESSNILLFKGEIEHQNRDIKLLRDQVERQKAEMEELRERQKAELEEKDAELQEKDRIILRWRSLGSLMRSYIVLTQRGREGRHELDLKYGTV